VEILKRISDCLSRFWKQFPLAGYLQEPQRRLQCSVVLSLFSTIPRTLITINSLVRERSLTPFYIAWNYQKISWTHTHTHTPKKKQNNHLIGTQLTAAFPLASYDKTTVNCNSKESKRLHHPYSIGIDTPLDVKSTFAPCFMQHILNLSYILALSTYGNNNWDKVLLPIYIRCLLDWFWLQSRFTSSLQCRRFSCVHELQRYKLPPPC